MYIETKNVIKSMKGGQTAKNRNFSEIYDVLRLNDVSFRF